MEFIANVNEFIKGKFTLTHMPIISYTYQWSENESLARPQISALQEMFAYRFNA